MCVALCLLAALLAAPPAKPTPAVRDARGYLERARALMDELEYEEALEPIKLIVADESAEPQVMLEALVRGGVVAVILNRDTEARLYFLSALRRDPSVSLPREYAETPRVVAFFKLVQDEVRTEARSSPAVVAPTVGPPTPKEMRDEGATGEQSQPLVLPSAIAAGALAVAGIAAYGGAVWATNVFRDATVPVPEREQARTVGVAFLVGAGVAAGGAIALTLYALSGVTDAW